MNCNQVFFISNKIRSPNTIRKQLQVRSKNVNSRISFDLCPEIETALKKKGMFSKFEMISKNENSDEKFIPKVYVQQSLENTSEKMKSLFEFEENEEAFDKTLNVLSETQLSDVVEPSGFWNNSLFENRQSPTKNQVKSQQSIIFEESETASNSFEITTYKRSATDSFETCESSNYSFSTAMPTVGVDESLEPIFEKSKSLYEFEDNEEACNNTLNVLSEKQLSEEEEPSEFWSHSLLENHSSRTKLLNTQQSIIFEDSEESSGSTTYIETITNKRFPTNSFETCESSNSSYFTAAGKSSKQNICELLMFI